MKPENKDKNIRMEMLLGQLARAQARVLVKGQKTFFVMGKIANSFNLIGHTDSVATTELYQCYTVVAIYNSYTNQ